LIKVISVNLVLAISIKQLLDVALDEYLDCYIDDVILPEIPENIRYYFDDEALKRDFTYDGRGCLASYDGNELEADVNWTTYLIYRR